MATNKAAEAMLNGKYQHGWNASLTNDSVQLHVWSCVRYVNVYAKER